MDESDLSLLQTPTQKPLIWFVVKSFSRISKILANVWSWVIYFHPPFNFVAPSLTSCFLLCVWHSCAMRVTEACMPFSIFSVMQIQTAIEWGAQRRSVPNWEDVSDLFIYDEVSKFADPFPDQKSFWWFNLWCKINCRVILLSFFCNEADLLHLSCISDFEMSELKFEYFSGCAKTKAAHYQFSHYNWLFDVDASYSAATNWMRFLQVDSSAGKVQFCRKKE